MAKKIILFIISYIVWCLLNWPPDQQHLFFGVLVAGFVAYITGDLFFYSSSLLRTPRKLALFAFYFVPLFLANMVKASLLVAYRILHPNLPIRPGIVRVKTSLKSDIGRTLLANTITLTADTMTVDLDPERGVIYVHWMNVASLDAQVATERLVRRWEKILEKIFE